MVGNIDSDGVLGVLCNECTELKMNKGIPMSLKAIAMKNDQKL